MGRNRDSLGDEQTSIILWTKLFTEKNLIPDCNKSAYRKGEKRLEHTWNDYGLQLFFIQTWLN